jgi:hypothetical protein
MSALIDAMEMDAGNHKRRPLVTLWLLILRARVSSQCL